MIRWTYERFCQNKNFLDAYITKFYGTPLRARTPLTLISPKNNAHLQRRNLRSGSIFVSLCMRTAQIGPDLRLTKTHNGDARLVPKDLSR